MSKIGPRFTATARKSAARLSFSDSKESLQDLIVAKKKNSKKEKTVAHLFEEVSTKCSNHEKLKVLSN